VGLGRTRESRVGAATSSHHNWTTRALRISISRKLCLSGEDIARPMCCASMGAGHGEGRKSMTWRLSSGSNHGRFNHRFDSTLVLAAAAWSTLPRIDNKMSSVSMVSLSTSCASCKRNRPSISCSCTQLVLPCLKKHHAVNEC
jgi:hypothetical protein